MAGKDKMMSVTIKIHPRYAGKILEALALAEVTARRNPNADRISRVVAAADYALAAKEVGRALGGHMAKNPGHEAWRRWLSDKIIAFAAKVHAEPESGGF